MNKLFKESSLYLLQHAKNPVNWYAWSDKGFQIAKSENKLVGVIFWVFYDYRKIIRKILKKNTANTKTYLYPNLNSF